MTQPNTFLITYGLHNFVTHRQNADGLVFTIAGSGNPKLVRHAHDLIAGTFGPAAQICSA